MTGQVMDNAVAPVPVWLFAPLGRDAALLRSGLPRGDGLRIARTADDLRVALAEANQVGVLVMTQEALMPETLDVLAAFTAGQPPWAELPILLLVDDAGSTMRALEQFQTAVPRSKVLVLHRPVRLSELATAVETMRRSRQRQFDLRAYIERQEQLRRELNHRVKNILATVQALYGLTQRTSEDLAAFDAVFQPRLAAMARVHEVLFEASYGDVALTDLITAVLAPYAGDERVQAAGDPVSVPAEIGQSLALIVHELVTNAAKHGALSRSGGKVALHWHGQDVLKMSWTEANGPPVSPPERLGYGVSFMDATARMLGGEARFDYASGGLRFEADLPLPEANESLR